MIVCKKDRWNNRVFDKTDEESKLYSTQREIIIQTLWISMFKKWCQNLKIDRWLKNSSDWHMKSKENYQSTDQKSEPLKCYNCRISEHFVRECKKS